MYIKRMLFHGLSEDAPLPSNDLFFEDILYEHGKLTFSEPAVTNSLSHSLSLTLSLSLSRLSFCKVIICHPRQNLRRKIGWGELVIYTTKNIDFILIDIKYSLHYYVRLQTMHSIEYGHLGSSACVKKLRNKSIILDLSHGPWMDGVANFWLLRSDFNCLRLSRGKRLIWLVFFVLLGVWWWPLGLQLGEFASWDVDEAHEWSLWIVWQILGHYNLTFSSINLARGKGLIWVVFSALLGIWGGHWDHGGGTWPLGTWMRPNHAIHGLFSKFWAATNRF